MTNEEQFAIGLKELCKSFKVAKLECLFAMKIEDHSVSHKRGFRYVSASENEGRESCELETVEKRTL